MHVLIGCLEPSPVTCLLTVFARFTAGLSFSYDL